MIDCFDKNRTDKREIKELKAKETLKKNSFCNGDKKSTRKNSSSKIFTPTTPKDNQMLNYPMQSIFDIEDKDMSGNVKKMNVGGLLEKRKLNFSDNECEENGVYFGPGLKCKK